MRDDGRRCNAIPSSLTTSMRSIERWLMTSTSTRYSAPMAAPSISARAGATDGYITNDRLAGEKSPRRHPSSAKCWQLDGRTLPKVKVAADLSHDQARDYEVTFIAALGRHPYGILTNLTEGGEGRSGSPASNATKARMSAAKAGKALSADRRKQQAIILSQVRKIPSWKGKRHSPAARAKMSAAHTGKTMSQETRQKMSRVRRGRKLGSRKSNRSLQFSLPLPSI